MKPSGHHWLGDIPAHWETKRLRFVMEKIEQGWSPQCHNYTAAPDEWGVLKVGCVNGSSFDPTENKALPETLEPQTRYEIQAGDILMSRANTKQLLGSAAIVHDVRTKLLLCDKLYRLIASDKIDRQFAVLALRSHIARFQYERDATGTSGSMQNIGQDTIKDLVLPLPPLDEQRTIVRFLDAKTVEIDALIAKKQRLLELMAEQRSALITKAVTKGLNSNAPMKPSRLPWLGDIPAHWTTIRLAMAMEKITNGYVGPTRSILVDDGVRYLQSLHIKDGAIDFARKPYYVTEEWSTAHRKSILRAGDVLIVQTGQVGQVCSVPPEFDGANCHALIVCRLRNGVGYGPFVSRVLQSDYGQQLFQSLQTGALHPHLEIGYVRDIHIPLPPEVEQCEIADYVDRALLSSIERTKAIRATMDRLHEYRAALITAAVTGQIDVRGWEPRKAAA